ncbi:P protein-like [Lepeophtheirus salmonis]|uniref:P protein-like n=1 Tax=Lepeophtheirus salmonis TaxID=72036 RepID=UPI003AF39DE6
MPYGACIFNKAGSLEERILLLEESECNKEGKKEDDSPWSWGRVIKAFDIFMNNPHPNTFHLTLGGSFDEITHQKTEEYEELVILLHDREEDSKIFQNVSISFIPKYYEFNHSEVFIDSNDVQHFVLNLNGHNPFDTTLQIKTTSTKSIPLLISGYMRKNSVTSLGNETFYGGLCLIGLYILIIGEFVHRSTASMLISTLLIGIMSHFNARPTFNHLMSWLDVETLVLLFSMMVIVSILSETNIFAYIGYKAYLFSKGRVWLLLTLLCLISALISSFIDNVTTILLLTPVIIQLSQVMETNTKSILIIVTIFSNIGGTATIIGDPPNVIIGSDPSFMKTITFAKFMIHIGPISLFIGIGAFLLIRFVLVKDLQNDLDQTGSTMRRLKEEISIWQRIYNHLPTLTKQERKVKTLTRFKVADLNIEIMRLQSSHHSRETKSSLEYEIQQKDCQIQNPLLLLKTLTVLSAMILLFCLNNVLHIEISMSWISLSGAISLIILADVHRIESVLSKVEWSTLIFFACLFVIMGTLESLGVLEAMGNTVIVIIQSLEPDKRLVASIVLILWVSGLMSSFVDNIPFTTMMIPVIKSITNLGVPLEPMIWALSLGACLGGNGTLVGASANLVAAGIAEQHGYKISFWDFFKIGFPVVLFSLIASTIYLLVCHVLFEWH